MKYYWFIIYRSEKGSESNAFHNEQLEAALKASSLSPRMVQLVEDQVLKVYGITLSENEMQDLNINSELDQWVREMYEEDYERWKDGTHGDDIFPFNDWEEMNLELN